MDRQVSTHSIPVIKFPAGAVRPLTAAECEAKVQETIASLDGCIDPTIRRHLKRELRGWQRYAAERAEGLSKENDR
jgi:hypothetical protein